MLFQTRKVRYCHVTDGSCTYEPMTVLFTFTAVLFFNFKRFEYRATVYFIVR